MKHSKRRTACVAFAAACPLFAWAQAAPLPSAAEAAKLFSFFITSEGPGKGADLGGLAGADAHCRKLASAVGAGHKTWHAYLSTQATDGQPAVHARERIGTGPWHNVRGAVVARNLSHLHGDNLDEARLGNNLSWATAFTEKNEPVRRAGDKPNEHDILTGSTPDGRAFTDAADHTCRNYTSAAADGSAQVGHFDRTGGGNTSWNSAHPSRGCGQANLVATGGAGLFYCFAVD
ncbi:MAG TPA: lectin [Albitalea sp.]|uniref:lectin n=1 Tax=Piscinibacter sp. TaxID=1903157 RepID=UPI002ED049C0